LRRGIRAIVSSRAKEPEKLKRKLIKRSTRAKDPKVYSSLKDIELDIVDLAGVRVALYFPRDREKVGQLIDEVLELTSPVKKFPEPHSEPLSKGLAGYMAEHYRARLREDRVPQAQRRYVQGSVEIQVASVLMHAWAEIDHDLRYKPTQGMPSEEELATLDEVNGLVLTGEIALEQLQRLIEQRVGRPDAQFENLYELQEFLSAQVPSMPSKEIGRVNFLLPLLKNAGIDTPSRLRPYLENITGEPSDSPIADRLIDAITAEDPERYQLFRAVLREERATDGTEEGQREFDLAMGNFLTRWISLERKLQSLTGKKSVSFTAQLLQPSLDRYGVGPFDREEIYYLRNIRNKLIHGQSVLSAKEIESAAARVETVLEHLENINKLPAGE
jgi:ppGpp synthetase/RelA/SpoT-type nucleotidyltranferase